MTGSDKSKYGESLGVTVFGCNACLSPPYVSVSQGWPMIATRGVKIRPLAYRPDFSQGDPAGGAVPECNIGHLPRSVRSGLEGQTRRAGTTAALHRRCANKYIRAGRPNPALPVTYGEACL